MRSPRGPDYAHRLTDVERRVLGGLLDAQRSILDSHGRPGPQPPRAARNRRAPFAVAVLTVLVLSAVAVVQLRPADPPAVPEAASAPSVSTAERVDTAQLLRELAGAARRGAPPPSTRPVKRPVHQSTLEVSVDAGAAECTVVGVSVELDYTTSIPIARPLPARLTTRQVSVDAGAAAGVGCPGGQARIVSSDPLRQLYSAGPTDNLAELWETRRVEWAGPAIGLALPPYADPRGLAGLVSMADTETDPAALNNQLTKHSSRPGGGFDRRIYWQMLADLLAGPELDRPHAVAALTVAAGNAGELTPVPAVTADIQGRPGVTVLVPYQMEGRDATAELTFDRAGGRLLQRVVRVVGAEPVQITVYL